MRWAVHGGQSPFTVHALLPAATHAVRTAPVTQGHAPTRHQGQPHHPRAVRARGNCEAPASCHSLSGLHCVLGLTNAPARTALAPTHRPPTTHTSGGYKRASQCDRLACCIRPQTCATRQPPAPSLVGGYQPSARRWKTRVYTVPRPHSAQTSPQRQRHCAGEKQAVSGGEPVLKLQRMQPAAIIRGQAGASYAHASTFPTTTSSNGVREAGERAARRAAAARTQLERLWRVCVCGSRGAPRPESPTGWSGGHRGLCPGSSGINRGWKPAQTTATVHTQLSACLPGPSRTCGDGLGC
jgi:hypothetical protein